MSGGHRRRSTKIDPVTRWQQLRPGRDEPLRFPRDSGPSPEGSDDVARILSVVCFKGVCRLITALSRRSLLTAEEIQGMNEVMTNPLDDPDVRDDEVIACALNTLARVLANAVVMLEESDEGDPREASD